MSSAISARESHTINVRAERRSFMIVLLRIDRCCEIAPTSLVCACSLPRPCADFDHTQVIYSIVWRVYHSRVGKTSRLNGPRRHVTIRGYDAPIGDAMRDT